jgi:hypothetical protein
LILSRGSGVTVGKTDGNGNYKGLKWVYCQKGGLSEIESTIWLCGQGGDTVETGQSPACFEKSNLTFCIGSRITKFGIAVESMVDKGVLESNLEILSIKRSPASGMGGSHLAIFLIDRGIVSLFSKSSKVFVNNQVIGFSTVGSAIWRG